MIESAWGKFETQIRPSWAVGRDQAFYTDGTNTWWVHPYDYLIQMGKGRLPYETRHCLGIRELERDRRKYGKSPGR